LLRAESLRLRRRSLGLRAGREREEDEQGEQNRDEEP